MGDQHIEKPCSSNTDWHSLIMYKCVAQYRLVHIFTKLSQCSALYQVVGNGKFEW